MVAQATPTRCLRFPPLAGRDGAGLSSPHQRSYVADVSMSSPVDAPHCRQCAANPGYRAVVDRCWWTFFLPSLCLRTDTSPTASRRFVSDSRASRIDLLNLRASSRQIDAQLSPTLFRSRENQACATKRRTTCHAAGNGATVALTRPVGRVRLWLGWYDSVPCPQIAPRAGTPVTGHSALYPVLLKVGRSPRNAW